MKRVMTPKGKYVYVANRGSNDITAYSINANGSLAAVERLIEIRQQIETAAGP